MTDVLLDLDESGADVRLAGGDLELDQGPRTAALLSLFCDARRGEDENLPGHAEPRPDARGDLAPVAPQDLRGWWADAEGDSFGSKLWLLARAKLTDLTVELAREYAAGALAWWVEDGLAEAVEVEADREGGLLNLEVRIYRGGARRWAQVWTSGPGGGIEGLRGQGLTLRILAG